LPPPIRFVVHNLIQAEAALRAGNERHAAVILESPPGAARYWGPMYFMALIEAARASVPEADWEAVLDCGEAPSLAIEALGRGVRAVRVTGNSASVAAVSDIALQLGGRVEPAPRPEMLDLSQVRDPLEAARRAFDAVPNRDLAAER
jgi:hypothetical protein